VIGRLIIGLGLLGVTEIEWKIFKSLLRGLILMKSKSLIIIIALIIVVGAASYFAMTYINQNSPTTALMNAKGLLSKNITTTYEFSVVPIVSGVMPTYWGGLPHAVRVSGLVTISRTPIMDATVINGTITMNTELTALTGRFNVALWRHGDELCYALEFGFMGVQSIIHCVPYVNLTSGYVEMINESKYIGTGSWNGKTTYCFTSIITITPTSVKNNFLGVPIVVNVTKLCLLSNGVPANATIHIYPAHQGPFGEFELGINMTLVSYEFVFNQSGFSAVTRGLIPG
jgi:hypothetical protein